MDESLIWHVYIIRNVTGRLYTGITNDPRRRLFEHNETKRGAKATRAGRPWSFVYLEPQETQSHALKREHQIKKLPRKSKLLLIQAHGEIERVFLKDQRDLRDFVNVVKSN